MKPLVSIIIPCHNAASWVGAAVESALAQTWADREVIVIDDGSTDGSADAARRTVHPQLRVVTQPNRGAAAARNHGLRLARGEFLQFLDADDLLAPDKLSLQLGLAPGADELLSGAWGRFHEDPNSAQFQPDSLWADLDPVDFAVIKLRDNTMMQPGCWLVPRALAEEAGPWDERLTLDDDGEYFTRLALHARRLRHCGEARVFYRSGLPGSLSRTRTDRAWRSQFLATELSVRHLRAREDSPRTRQAGADALHRLVQEAYPAVPDERRRISALVQELGGSRVPLPGGPRFQILARLIGWRLAKRLRDRLR